MKFKGSIVIGDPSYFVKTEDWEKCEYGDRMDQIGFTDFMCIRFPEDLQAVKEENSGQLFGGICQDSGFVVVVYLEELKAYRPDYEKAFYSKTNRAIILDFDGEVSSKEVEEVLNGETETYTSIFGNGNICFKSCYVDKREFNELRKD